MKMPTKTRAAKKARRFTGKVLVRLEPDDHAKMQARADANDRSLNQEMRAAVREHLARERP